MINRTCCTAVLMSLFLVMSCGKGEVGKTGTAGGAKATISGVPTTPMDVSAVSGDGRITVKWQPSQEATSYTIYYANIAGAAQKQREKISGITATSYDHIGVLEKTMYYYVVTASNAGGESSPSTESGAMVQTIALQAPVNVAASGGDGKITVKWKEEPGATSYNIYYATRPGIARPKGKKIEGIKSFSYQITDVKKKTMYFFTVTAVNTSGESPSSNESGAMP